MSMTANEASIADVAAFSVRRTIRIEAPVSKVWAAVTEPEHISLWFGRADFDDSGAGAQGTLTWDGYGSVPVRIEAIEPQRSVTYRWNNDDALGAPIPVFDETRATVFTFSLVETHGGVLLTVVESGFENTSDPAFNLEAHREGWNSELDKLVALLQSAP